MARRRALLAVVLLVLAGAACTSDTSDDAAPRTGEGSATDPPTTTEADGGDLLGGSRYLAYVRRTDEGGDELVRRDLRTGQERPVRSHDPGATVFSDVAVSPTGALAWGLTTAGRESGGVQLLPAIEDTPVHVAGFDVDCPQWRVDGVLSYTTTQDDRTRVIVADGETGEYLGAVPYDLPDHDCGALSGADDVLFARSVGDEPYAPAGAEIVTVAVDGSQEEVVGHVAGPCWPMFLAGSSDGSHLAATVYCAPGEGPDRWGVYVGTMGDDLRPLVAENEPDADPETAYQYGSPSWSADGSVLVYSRSETVDGQRQSRIFSVEPAGGDPIELVPASAYSGSLSGPSAPSG